MKGHRRRRRCAWSSTSRRSGCFLRTSKGRHRDWGAPPTEREVLVYDVLPVVIAGYVIGLGAIAITRFFFPRSSIKVIFYVVGACAGLAALFILWLSHAIGERNIRDFGTIAMLFEMPLAIATWAVISSYRLKREAR